METEAQKAKRKARYEKKREHWTEYHRERYKKNRDKERARVKAWQDANPVAFRMYQKARDANRRAARAGVAGTLTRDDVLSVFGQAGWKCADCGCRVDLSGNLDHVVSLGINGPNRVENCQVLCEPCHDKKSIVDRALVKAHKDTLSESVTAVTNPLLGSES